MFSLRHRLILSLLLLLIFLFVTPVVQAAPADIAGHWVEDSVKSLIDQGILNGYPDGSFRPVTKSNSPIRKGTGLRILLQH